MGATTLILTHPSHKKMTPPSQIKIEILGIDCPTCDVLYRSAQALVNQIQREGIQALPELEISVHKVENYLSIAAYHLSATPGLVINGQLISQGQAPNPQQLRQILQDFALGPKD
jgi:hypothetical protein